MSDLNSPLIEERREQVKFELKEIEERLGKIRQELDGVFGKDKYLITDKGDLECLGLGGEFTLEKKEKECWEALKKEIKTLYEQKEFWGKSG